MTIKNDKAIKEIKSFKNELENVQRALKFSKKIWHKMLVNEPDMETVIKVENVVYNLTKSINDIINKYNQAIERLIN